MPHRRRDLPRVAAPVLFGLFNLVSGLSGLDAQNAHVAAYAKATSLMPLYDWAVSFAALGLLIFAGVLGPQVARVTSAIAVFWWLLWSTFIAETVGQPGVSPRAVATTAGVAGLHLLLMPYRRDPKLDGAQRCDGP